jgi:hypothetical protein
MAGSAMPEDISARLFSKSYSETAGDIVRQRLRPPHSGTMLRPDEFWRVYQSGILAGASSPSPADDATWLTVLRDGAVCAGYCSVDADGLGWVSVADERLKPWWTAAAEALQLLGAAGPTFVRLETRGQYEVTVSRWLEDVGEASTPHLNSIVRELKRAAGEPEWES